MDNLMEIEDSCKGIKVLVVDDVVSNQDLIREYLDILGCVHDFAQNGKEALEKMKSNQYDLCLMDIQMPVLNGIEATRIIRQDISADCPVIAVTASVMKDDCTKYLEAGMNDILPKPVDLMALRSKIVQYGLKA